MAVCYKWSDPIHYVFFYTYLTVSMGHVIHCHSSASVVVLVCKLFTSQSSSPKSFSKFRWCFTDFEFLFSIEFIKWSKILNFVKVISLWPVLKQIVFFFYFNVRRVWRYQSGNQNPYIEEEPKTQWSKEKGQKDKQRSTKPTHKTKDRVTRTPVKTGGEFLLH